MTVMPSVVDSITQPPTLALLCSANIGFGTNCRRCGAFADLWQDRDVIALVRIVLRFFAEQPRTPAHGARSRRAGPSFGGRAVCDATNPPSDRRAPRCARQIGAGRLASRISAGARVGVIG